MARQLVLFGFIFLLAGIQLALSNSLRIQYNVEEDNDEGPSTLPPVDPPIEYQFLDTTNKLTKQPPKPSPVKEPITTVPESETDNDAENSEEDDEEARRSLKNGRLFQTRQGTSCGYHRLRPGQYLTVQTSNFNSGAYSNLEVCTWRFYGQQCVLKAYCPCFDIAQSSDCIGDYLKLTDTYSFALRFCGSVAPVGYYNSTTNNLKVRFRSDGSNTGNGFLCYVTCTGPAQPDPRLPNLTCPLSINNPSTTSTTPRSGTTTTGGTTGGPDGEVTGIPPQTPPPTGK